MYVLVRVCFVSQGSVESLCEWSVYSSASVGGAERSLLYEEQVIDIFYQTATTDINQFLKG